MKFLLLTYYTVILSSGFSAQLETNVADVQVLEKCKTTIKVSLLWSGFAYEKVVEKECGGETPAQ